MRGEGPFTSTSLCTVLLTSTPAAWQINDEIYGKRSNICSPVSQSNTTALLCLLNVWSLSTQETAESRRRRRKNSQLQPARDLWDSSLSTAGYAGQLNI